MRFHPDRQSDPSPAARERAEFRMREVNAAWEVLRNPAARAAYDRTLRSPGAAAPAGGVSAEPVTPVDVGIGARLRQRVPGDVEPVVSVATSRAEPADASAGAQRLEPADRTGPVVQPPRWIRWLPLLIGGAVLLIGVAVAALNTDRPDDDLKVQVAEPFAVGSCVALVGVPTAEPGAQVRPQVVEVPCNSPNSGQVVAKVAIPRPCPPGTRAVQVADADESLCLTR